MLTCVFRLYKGAGARAHPGATYQGGTTGYQQGASASAVGGYPGSPKARSAYNSAYGASVGGMGYQHQSGSGYGAAPYGANGLLGRASSGAMGYEQGAQQGSAAQHGFGNLEGAGSGRMGGSGRTAYRRPRVEVIPCIISHLPGTSLSLRPHTRACVWVLVCWGVSPLSVESGLSMPL
jgi:hypothetical protein